MQYIFVTGYLGYLGKVLTRKLLKKGYYVIGVDKAGPATPQISHHAAFFQCDITDSIKLRRISQQFKKIDGCVHLAARIEVGEGEKNPQLFSDVNFGGTKNLISVMDRTVHGTPIVFASSAAVYEAKDGPLREIDAVAPVSVYGKTKCNSEIALAASRHPTIALRFFNLAGAAQDWELGENHIPETHLIPIIIRAIKQKREDAVIKIFGDDWKTPDGTCVRDYVHIEDVADACIKSLETLLGDIHEKPFAAFNIASGVPRSNLEVVREVMKRMNVSDVDIQLLDRRPGDVGILYADITAARVGIGWRPKRSFKDIIADAVGYELRHGKFTR